MNPLAIERPELPWYKKEQMENAQAEYFFRKEGGVSNPYYQEGLYCYHPEVRWVNGKWKLCKYRQNPYRSGSKEFYLFSMGETSRVLEIDLYN